MSEYTQWPRLDSIPRELDEVEQALIDQDFNVVRLNNPKGRELSNGIEDFINEYGYERENRLLIYFSGHGHSIGNKGFLLPADTPLPDEKGFRRETVPMSRVMSWARDMEAKHALFLFDSCFSGSVFQSRNLPNASDRYIRQATAEPVRQFITAGGADEEVPAKSTFTPALVRAINGEGDLNSDGYITGSELGVHLSQLVPRFVDQTPQYGKIKDFDLAQGDFVFFKQEAQETSQVASISNHSLDAIFWQSAERGNTIEEYQAYVDRYPNGAFTRLAQTRIARLKQSQVPVEEEQLTQPVVSTKGALTIRVVPSDARIRIMNIEPPYRDGIELELNKSFDILVTREGYKSDRRQVRLTQQNQTEKIALERVSDITQQSMGSFVVKLEPATARVCFYYQDWICGADTRLPIGNEYPVYASADGFLDFVSSVSLEEDQRVININLTELPVGNMQKYLVPKKSFKLQQQCNGGSAESCSDLAEMYHYGRGTTEDKSRAAELYRQACNGDSASGCSGLGWLYAMNNNLEDISRAVELFKKGIVLSKNKVAMVMTL